MSGRGAGSPSWQALALAAAVVLGCAQERYEPAIDLVAGLATAEVTGDPGRVRAIEQADRRLGWRVDERGVWGIGDFSSLELIVEEPLPLTLEFRCFPAVAEAPVESLTIKVNGARITTLSLEGSSREYLLSLPSAALKHGSNRFLFLYERAGEPPPGAAAVGWEYVRFRPLGSLPVAVNQAGGRMLYLPYGSQVDYFFELPAAARLAISARRFVTGHPGAFARARRGDPRGGLAAELEVLGEAPRQLPELAAAKPVELSPPESGLARLTLRAEAAAGAAGGILFADPRIEALASPSRPAGGTPTARRPPAGRPNVLLYVIDTLRADHLGAYGYPKRTSPNIDSLAAEAVVFDQAIAQSSWTKSAMASVFTGLLPTAHGVQAPEHRLSQDLWTLAEMLRDAGYQTGGFAANGYLTEAQGFAQGFDAYFMSSVRSPELHSEALAWLAAADLQRPFFLYVHTVEPHGPYAPPEEHRRRFAGEVAPDMGSIDQMMAIALDRLPASEALRSDLVALYDAEIASNDAELGRLLAALEQMGVYEDTLVIFLSDHGEAFFEHGRFGHGNDLHDEVLRVPLIIRPPGGVPSSRVSALAQQVDILPTLAAFLGPPLERRVHGRDLLAEAAGGGPERIVISHIDRTGGRAGRPRISLIRGDWKVIEPLSRAAPPIGLLRPGDRRRDLERELYHRGRDPGETEDLAGLEPSLARRLAILARAEALRLGVQASEESELSPDELRQLQALGYLR